MSLKMLLLSTPFLASVCLPLPTLAQDSSSQPKAPTAASQPHQASGASFVLRKYSRMVNLELVVKDSKGHHIEGLKAEDFRIEEQTPDKSRKWNQQTIADFREMHTAGMATPLPTQAQMPKGVYTNAVTVQKDPAPPTILLVDGLNTTVEHQAQVHVQMLRMLRQLPPNVPVAVFLLGERLVMLQSFTTDPKLLQTALSSITTPAGVGASDAQPTDNPDAVGNSMGGMGVDDPNLGVLIAAAKNFDERIFIATMDERANRTINALTSLGNNVAGYPGRKNLLWLSTSFPINLSTILAVGAPVGESAPGSDQWAEVRGHWRQLQHLSAVLSDAKVAVYPVNLAGVQTLEAYRASARPPDVTPTGMADNALRDSLTQTGSVETMREIAEGTGGIVCTGDNDLGDCVRKAVDDSSDFYEISYYSDSTDWNGEFRKIAIKSSQHGTRLAYRQGYFATPEGGPDPKVQKAQLQSDCENYLDATSIPFTAASLPSGAQGQVKFSLQIDSSVLTLRPTADGKYPLNLAIAVCTYDKKRWPLQVMNYPVNDQTLTATGKLADTISIPGPKPAAVRVLVKDIPSGRLGSIYIETDGNAGAPSQAAQNGAATKLRQ